MLASVGAVAYDRRMTTIHPGAILRALRSALGLSMRDAAERAGVAKSTWQRWEDGALPAAPAALRAAAALHTTVEAVWGGAPLPEQPTDETEAA